MTHEIRDLFRNIKTWQQAGKKSVLVSVIALEGNSYRRPGVRMAISEYGDCAGAVSGGCIEKEIERQAQSVFKTGRSRMMTYDGRLRTGCEGMLHILIEPVFLTDQLINDFESALKLRQHFRMDTWYYRSVGEYQDCGTLITLNNSTYSLNPFFTSHQVQDQVCFTQKFDPLFHLYIFGAEHDAVQLCRAAKLLGWEVTIVAPAEESKSCDHFPGADALITPAFNNIDTSAFDEQSAVVIMTHSFNKDVQYLLSMKDIKPAYLGIVGAMQRRERILSTLLDFDPDISTEFLDRIHGPAGISIGAENAAEISVSVLAEILSVIRHQQPVALREKVGSIHG